MQRSACRMVVIVALCLWAAPAVAQRSPNERAPAERDARFRIGLEVGAGLAWGDSEGAAVGLLGQIGAQLSDLVAVLYMPTLYFMGFGSDVDAQGIVGTSQGGMFVLDVSKGFELGAGGGYFFGSIGECSATATDCTAGSFHGAVINGRIAFIIGFDVVRARIGIPISINTQTVFNGNDRLTSIIAAIGLQRY